MKLNLFLLRYVLGEDIVQTFTSNGIETRFEETIPPTSGKMYDESVIQDTESYNDFTADAIRIELFKDGSRTVIYMFFRNGKQDRPDLGSRKYTFARPSSIEIGIVSNKNLNVFYKKHFDQDYPFSANGLDFNDAQSMKQAIKDVEYDIINSIIDQYNVIAGTAINKKLMSNGHAMKQCSNHAAVSGQVAPTCSLNTEVANIQKQL